VAALHADQRGFLSGTFVDIRHADPARDAAQCAEIYGPFVTDTVISLEERPPGSAEMAARIEQTSHSYPWLVSQDGGSVVGYAYASRHRERAAYRWAADVAVYVHEGHRRRGIGHALYHTLFELLARQGVRIACAGITLPNQASVALHESCGFQPVGIYRRIGWKMGAWWDVGWWQLELPGADPPAEPGPRPPLS
jgi:L-amino acid N-acyltransferase YncA